MDQTHHYDGVVGPIYHQLLLNQKPPHITFEEALQRVESWLSLSPLKEKHHVINTIHLLRSDHSGNFDVANQIRVEDLLPRVVEFVETFESSGKDLFLLNLGEIITSGSCAQGRTTRLLSFYIPFQ
jgi:hypothetical protein